MCPAVKNLNRYVGEEKMENGLAAGLRRKLSGG